MNKDQLRYKRTRDDVVARLGGKCPCGFSDPRALQIDHIHGGGGEDRRKFGGRWRLFYEYVIDNPDKFQILCSNCNAIKRIENSEHRVARPPVDPIKILTDHQAKLAEAATKMVTDHYLKEYEKLAQRDLPAGGTGTV